MSEATKELQRTVPIADTITEIGNGYPDKLVIFRQPALSCWWVRYCSNGQIVRRSTKISDQRHALKFAKTFYEDVLLRECSLLPLSASPSGQR